MAEYSNILSIKYPDNQWSITGNEYDSLNWMTDNKDKKPSKAELDKLSDEVDAEIAWITIKKNRNKLLAESDWTQISDVPKKTQKKWKEYRQSLRDIPQFFEDPDFVVFPEKPE